MLKRLPVEALLKRPILSYGLPAMAVIAVLIASYIAPIPAGLGGSQISYVGGPCTAAGISALPASPHAASGTTVVTGTATCPGIANFRFWVRTPDGVWTMRQDYTATNTFNWNINGLAAGSYGLEVDVRNQGDTVVYDKVANLTYQITVAGPCLTANLTVTGGSSPTTGGTGGTFTMTGSSTGCPNPVYRFWIQDPGRAWSMVQDYSATTTHTWGPIGAWLIGQYRMEVDVRDASETTVYDVVHNLTYNLVGCTAVLISTTPASPQTHGTSITINATGAACPGTPEYRFWVLDPVTGTHWSIVQDYSPVATHTWTQTSVVGTYHLEVDVRDAGSHEVYEFVANMIFTTT
jgi:hypothetical protein